MDTSVFSLDYDYDSEPYLPTNLGLKEAKMVDPWTLDFRHKLASRENIGKSHLANATLLQAYTQISKYLNDYLAINRIKIFFSAKIQIRHFPGVL